MRRRLKVFAADVLHNCVAHPLLPFLPKCLGQRLHDWTAELWPA